MPLDPVAKVTGSIETIIKIFDDLILIVGPRLCTRIGSYDLYKMATDCRTIKSRLTAGELDNQMLGLYIFRFSEIETQLLQVIEYLADHTNDRVLHAVASGN